MNLLAGETELFKLLSDPTRLRLLALLADHELTVAELVAVLEAPQSRVSTHLGKLREAGLVQDRQDGSSRYHRLDTRMPAAALATWELLRGRVGEDRQLVADAARAVRVIADRQATATWAERVAGRMARHYSPGRTWESLTRGLLGLLDLGRVIDIASGDGGVAELVAPHAEHVTCVDHSAQLVATGSERLAHLDNVRFVRGDMHALPFDDGRFDQALLMTSLSFSKRPAEVLAEAARVLRTGGALVGTVLSRHTHRDAVEPYDHQNLGFSSDELRQLLVDTGFAVRTCALTARERRRPNLETLTFHARKSP